MACSQCSSATITLSSGELAINKNLTISGPGANRLTVQRSMASGTAPFRIFNIAAGNLSVTISGLTITNGDVSSGNNQEGGGIFNRSTGALTVTGCTISANNSGDYGGGIYNLGVMNITNSTIDSNTAFTGGGGIYNFGTVTLTNSTIVYNYIYSVGGGIYNDGAVNLTSSTVAAVAIA